MLESWWIIKVAGPKWRLLFLFCFFWSICQVMIDSQDQQNHNEITSSLLSDWLKQHCLDPVGSSGCTCVSWSAPFSFHSLPAWRPCKQLCYWSSDHLALSWRTLFSSSLASVWNHPGKRQGIGDGWEREGLLGYTYLNSRNSSEYYSKITMFRRGERTQKSELDP